MMWIRLFVLMTVLMASYSATAQSWSEIEREARGQTVYFYAWGGSPAINQYIDRWAQIASERHQINVEHVKVDDISMVIQGIQTAKRVGASDQGSVDLLWINGENFARMKRDGLLGEPFVAGLPSAEHINLDDPTIATDFSVPTDGLEAPWGRAQLVLMHDQARRPNPPRSMQALLQYVQTNPGRITYPEPPNFHGTTFLKQVLLETTPDPQWLSEPYAAERFQAATEPMWALLDALHPHLWRSGREFPDSAEAMMDLFADGLLDMAIPFNASARAGAQVWINLLLSVEAQADKASPSVWGDPTVIDVGRLQGADQERFEALELGPATLTGAELGTPLAEPHASWVEPLEAAWKSRYFGQAQ
jgi:putative thiamine transport system substrate-binding protein